MPRTDAVSESSVLLTEYERIKEEQKSRISFRDNLLYFTLAGSAAVLTAESRTEQPRLLLVIPVISLILGWTYLANDEKISSAGRYIRDHLEPRLTELVSAPRPVFGWETYHRHDTGRSSRKRLQTAVDLCTYLLIPAACVTVFLCSSAPPPPLIAVATAQLAALGVLGWQFLRYADL
ncbi:hypothetical protein ACFVAM_23385 [Streptomyces californicus]|uniref:hypothetical protein n=1 Tax=Streptomyces TaxID=1883 RepID=UPI000889D004|nr:MULTISPECIES: hypothetical protein [unclassified Streptomyces griseus subgroup]MYW78835.1 hypothetical protein [Streptomyces sp. SID8369]QSS95425.1 hypothetical protein H3V39_33725 [Streptomyces sp. M54]SDE35434.1 hypothetical protein F610DRAFT_06897 [Streptomyces sp. LaPpAH-199]